MTDSERVKILREALEGLSHGYAPDSGPHAEFYSADERKPCFCPWHRHTESSHTDKCVAARRALAATEPTPPEPYILHTRECSESRGRGTPGCLCGLEAAMARKEDLSRWDVNRVAPPTGEVRCECGDKIGHIAPCTVHCEHEWLGDVCGKFKCLKCGQPKNGFSNAPWRRGARPKPRMECACGYSTDFPHGSWVACGRPKPTEGPSTCDVPGCEIAGCHNPEPTDEYGTLPPCIPSEHSDNLDCEKCRPTDAAKCEPFRCDHGCHELTKGVWVEPDCPVHGTAKCECEYAWDDVLQDYACIYCDGRYGSTSTPEGTK